MITSLIAEAIASFLLNGETRAKYPNLFYVASDMIENHQRGKPSPSLIYSLDATKEQQASSKTSSRRRLFSHVASHYDASIASVDDML